MSLPSLYHCTEDVKIVLDAFVDDDSQVALDTIEGVVGIFEMKAENVAAYILNMEAQEAMLGEHIKNMQDKKAKMVKKSEDLRAKLANAMKTTGIMKISAANGSFCASFRKNPPKVEIYDEAQIPQEFMREIPARLEVDKTAIKDAIKSGIEVAGANLVQGESFQIK